MTMNCLKCEDNYQMDESTKQCLVECAPNQYRISLLNTCDECGENCSRCEDSTRDCLKCLPYHEISANNKTQCHPISSELKLTQSYFSEIDNQIHIFFDEQVKIESESSITLALSSNNSNTINREIKIEKINPEGYELMIKPHLKSLELELEGAEITISESSTSTIHTKDKPGEPFTGLPTKITGVNYYDDVGFSESLASFNSYSMYILSLIVLIMMILSIGMALIMIKLFQLIYFLLFLDLRFPRNVAIYLNGFRKTLLEYIPMPINLNRGSPKRRALTCKLHKIFKMNKLDCVGINNYGGY